MAGGSDWKTNIGMARAGNHGQFPPAEGTVNLRESEIPDVTRSGTRRSSFAEHVIEGTLAAARSVIHCPPAGTNWLADQLIEPITSKGDTDQHIYLDNFQIAAVPEPSSRALMLLGGGAFAFALMRRRS